MTRVHVANDKQYSTFIVSSCPQTKLEDDLHRLHSTDDVNVQQQLKNMASECMQQQQQLGYSLTFCIRVMSPERHQRKPAVQAAIAMLRMPSRRRPVTGQPATHTSHIRRAILRTPPSPAGHWPAACRPRRAFALCRHIVGWTQACN